MESFKVWLSSSRIKSGYDQVIPRVRPGIGRGVPDIKLREVQRETAKEAKCEDGGRERREAAVDSRRLLVQGSKEEGYGEMNQGGVK